MASFSYLLLALLGLGVLILIHELGHYFMARWVGIKVLVFSIGFGRPIWSYQRGETRWIIGAIPFGGYVQLAGGEGEEESHPSLLGSGTPTATGATGVGTATTGDTVGSFFASSPIDRIKVLLMGPLVNIVFAFLLFTCIWIGGGREKPLSEFTNTVGWVDPHSELYQKGVRSGDLITAYNDRPCHGIEDHLTAAMIGGPQLKIEGIHRPLLNKKNGPFTTLITPYQNPYALESGMLTSGILQPASFLVVKKPAKNSPLLPAGSAMLHSGIEAGERIVWMDGHLIYSQLQMMHLLNEGRSLLTIKRNGHLQFARVYRVSVDELKLDPSLKGEIEDWQFEQRLKKGKENLYFIPYALNSDCIVESVLPLIDDDKKNQILPIYPYSDLEAPLQKGDQIVAVDGQKISHPSQLLAALQERKVHLITEKLPSPFTIKLQEADSAFQKVDQEALQALIARIGVEENGLFQQGNLKLLNPVAPKKWLELIKEDQVKKRREQVQLIEDPDKRSSALKMLEKQENQLVLGIYFGDQSVTYNPGPLQLFQSSLSSIVKTLGALFTGALNPKWLAGPVGIVQTIQTRWEMSWIEGLFWLATISLNLGVLNLLPLPVLDGGKILIFAYEWASGKPIKPKTLEKLLLPCALLLIGFFIFITYHDLLRLFNRFWP